MTAPPWALVPTLEPIFSLLFMENVPTSHTDKLLGWLFKGSINNLFWWGAVFALPPAQAPEATKTPPSGLDQL